MADFPALPLFTDAYLSDTRHLSQAEHGAYLLLLMTAWRSKDCSLPNDDNLLAKYAGCSLRVWVKQKPAVMAFFQLCDDGTYRQKRLTSERNFVESKRKTNKKNALARYLKNKKTDSANALPEGHDARATPTPTPTPQERKEPSTTSEPSFKTPSPMISIGASPGEAPDRKIGDQFPVLDKLRREGHGRRYVYPPSFVEFWDAYSERRKADSKPDAYKAWRKAIAVDKLDPAMLVICATNYAAYCRAGHEPPLVATWFNKQRWNSQASQGAQEPNRGNGHGRLKSNEQLADEVFEELERDRREAEQFERECRRPDGMAQEFDGYDQGNEPGSPPGPGFGDQGDGEGHSAQIPTWFDQESD